MLAWLRVHGLKPGTIKGPGRQSRSSPERRLNPPHPTRTRSHIPIPLHGEVERSDQIIRDAATGLFSELSDSFQQQGRSHSTRKVRFKKALPLGLLESSEEVCSWVWIFSHLITPLLGGTEIQRTFFLFWILAAFLAFERVLLQYPSCSPTVFLCTNLAVSLLLLRNNTDFQTYFLL